MNFNRKNGEFPLIMGILNITPDSFSDGGMFYSAEKAIAQGLKLINEGADIIDIGGESTRPGAPEVTAEEEIGRVLPVIEGILAVNPKAIISIDTTKYDVAREALAAGASIINDISGLQFDERLAALAADNTAALILMHMQGTPRNMQSNPVYGNVVEDVFEFLYEKVKFAQSLGVKDVIADVGIGFGKTAGHNLELLRNLEYFRKLGVPLLLGISRKSFIGKALNIEIPAERDLSTAFIHALLPNFGGDIIRVHNVSLINTLKSVWEILKYLQ